MDRPGPAKTGQDRPYSVPPFFSDKIFIEKKSGKLLSLWEKLQKKLPPAPARAPAGALKNCPAGARGGLEKLLRARAGAGANFFGSFSQGERNFPLFFSMKI